MNWDRIEGNWQRLHDKVRQQWSKLTDDEIAEIEGRREQLAGTIQRAYKVSPNEAERQIKQFAESLGDERTPDPKKHS